MTNGEKSYFDPLVLARLSNLYLRARWVVEGIMSGIHRSRSKGFSVEFEEHREYSPGDEIRRIDWKALGKFDKGEEKVSGTFSFSKLTTRFFIAIRSDRPAGSKQFLKFIEKLTGRNLSLGKPGRPTKRIS